MRWLDGFRVDNPLASDLNEETAYKTPLWQAALVGSVKGFQGAKGLRMYAYPLAAASPYQFLLPLRLCHRSNLSVRRVGSIVQELCQGGH